MHPSRRILLLCLPTFLMLVTSCSGVKTVTFSTPVDTKDKPIELQEKKTFELKKVGVYADNKFAGARLNNFTLKNDSTALVIIEPENIPINNSAYYAFRTWADFSGPFYYEFHYPKNYKHRYIPKIKTGNEWSILDSIFVFKRDNIVTVRLELGETPITVAAQEVQTSEDVTKWFTNLTNSRTDIVHIKSVGITPGGRNIPVLDIFSGNPKGKDVIVLLTRQHPPEVTGYFAFQSFLKTMLSESKLSENFYKKYHVIAFPIMNPDGVDMGHWRHNSAGVDTNRDWSIYNQPEVRRVVKFIGKSLKRNRAKIVLGLDFHSTWHDVFYTNKERRNTTLPTFIDDWFRALETEIPGYKVNEAPGNSKKPVSKGWFLYGHNAVGITYEIGDTTPRENIKQIGNASAKAMMRLLLNTSD